MKETDDGDAREKAKWQTNEKMNDEEKEQKIVVIVCLKVSLVATAKYNEFTLSHHIEALVATFNDFAVRVLAKRVHGDIDENRKRNQFVANDDGTR